MTEQSKAIGNLGARVSMTHEKGVAIEQSQLAFGAAVTEQAIQIV